MAPACQFNLTPSRASAANTPTPPILDLSALHTLLLQLERTIAHSVSCLRGVEDVLQVFSYQFLMWYKLCKSVVVIVEQPYKYTVLSTGASLSVVVVVVR